jgi:DNA-binding response OmpR family regulator
MAREKILVVNHDLDFLSRIYLALIHRKFKVEACDNPEEITERLKRFKPSVIVLDLKEYNVVGQKLKIPAIIIVEKEETTSAHLNGWNTQLKKPVHVDELVKAVEKLV